MDMALNFGLLDTSIPEKIGAMPANALAMRRQRLAQDEQMGLQREQQQMQNALARMQMQKSQGDMAEEEAYKGALRGAGGNYEQAMPQLMQASPSRAMGLQKQMFEQKKGAADMAKGDIELNLKKLDYSKQVLGTLIQDPNDAAVNSAIDEIARVTGMPPEQADAKRQEILSIKDPKARQDYIAFHASKTDQAIEMLRPKASAPTELSRMMAERDALPQGDPRRAAYDQAISKQTTHAPASVTNVNMTQEKEESKAVGKGFGEQFNELQKAGLDAGGKIARFSRLEQLLTGVTTGKLTPTTTQLSAAAESLGLNIDPNLPAKQAAEALSNEIALQLRNPSGGAGMPGALSDKDREFLVGMTPGLGKTAEGNQMIIDSAKKLAKRDQDVARIAREYRKKNGTLDEGFYDELQRFSEANPLFKGGAAAKPASPSAPAVGTVQGGYRFKGGNPADPNSWQKVQ
jgi:hypothetical protein